MAGPANAILDLLIMVSTLCVWAVLGNADPWQGVIIGTQVGTGATVEFTCKDGTGYKFSQIGE